MMPADGPVPNLRFPEFRDAGSWEVKRLGEIADCYQPETISLSTTSNGGRYPVYGANGVIGWLDRYNHEDSEVIVGCRGQCGNVFLTPPKAWINGNAMVIHVREVEHMLCKEFLFHLLSASDLSYLVSGSAQPQITGEIKRHEIPVPSRPEQQKIADCLSSLDDLIRAEGARLGALKDHKRALMQRLFPRPGETTPRLRFPEFRDAGLWEVKRLSEVCEINPPSGELPESFIYIDLESVSAGELLQKKVISRNEAPSRAQRLLSPGDIIYQMVRPYQRNNLLFAIVGDMKYVASTGYAQLRAKSSAEFLFQLVHTDSFVGSVLQKCTGSNYPAINPSDLGEIHVSVPSNPEQHRIADCLASLDELIRAQGERLAALKAHKRGLMQQLFPQGLA